MRHAWHPTREAFKKRATQWSSMSARDEENVRYKPKRNLRRIAQSLKEKM